MSLKTRMRRLEKEHRKQYGEWEAPVFVVWKEEDEARVDAEMELWREEIERDKARGRTVFGFSFLLPDSEEVAAR